MVGNLPNQRAFIDVWVALDIRIVGKLEALSIEGKVWSKEAYLELIPFRIVEGHGSEVVAGELECAVKALTQKLLELR
jgi:hypothetical protein